MHRHGKHYIKCIACNKYPDIVKKHTIKSQNTKNNPRSRCFI
jgi:hypothetical protein